MKKAVKKDDLESVVLKLIQNQIRLYADAKELIASLNRREISKSRYRIYQDQINDVKRRINAFRERKAALYSDYARGVIDEAEYNRVSREYASGADDLNIFLAEIEREAAKLDPEYRGSKEWSRLVEEYLGCTELDEKMISALIEEIVVFNDGHYEVKFKHRDEMEAVLMLASTRKKEAARYA